MLPVGHIAAGYLAGKLASEFLPELGQPKYLQLTMLFSIIPDLDFFFAFAKNKKWVSSESINHRKFLTHAPLLYLLAFIVWFIVFPQSRLVAFTFIFGVWTHFIIDTISASGIIWLYPFSSKMYGVAVKDVLIVEDQRFFQHWYMFVKEYMKVWAFKLELITILISLIIFFLSK